MALGSGRPPEDFTDGGADCGTLRRSANAIVIAYDVRPVLTTDPWIEGNAYFGSWVHDYEIPQAQLQAEMRSITGSRTATPTT